MWPKEKFPSYNSKIIQNTTGPFKEFSELLALSIDLSAQFSNLNIWIQWTRKKVIFISQCVHMHAQSHMTLHNPMDCSHSGFLSMGFSRQEYWSGLPRPPPGDLPETGIEPNSPVSPALAAILKVKVAQSCPTLDDPMDQTIHGILQARILEWVAYPFSRGSSQPRDQTQVSHIAGKFFTSWVIREVAGRQISKE